MATTSLALATALVLLVLEVGAASSASPYMATCEIDCSGYVSSVVKTADPVNCHRYYFCYSATYNSEVSFACPSGQDFDIVTGECAPPSTPAFRCTPPCEKCSFDCASPVLGKAASAFDCSVYFACSLGVVSETRQCESAAAPYFDGQRCQPEREKCCTCRPECTAADATAHRWVRDHRNCTNFFVCMAAGIPDESSHGHCEEGNFNAEMEQCQEGAPCVAVCQEGGEAGCVDDFVCESYGDFPKCPDSCDPHYYHCSYQDIGHRVEASACTRNYVVDPALVLCVPREQCLSSLPASRKTP